MPRDFSAQAAERGAAGYPLLAHENLYDWHDCEQRNRSRRSGGTFYSQLTARLQFLSRSYTGTTGARTYKSVDARLLLRRSYYSYKFHIPHSLAYMYLVFAYANLIR